MFASKSCVRNPLLSAPTLPSRTQLSLDSVSFSPDKVESLLSNLDSDSATALDGINPCVLKNCSSALTHTPSVLFTLSFAQGHLPLAWKSANIPAPHKKMCKNRSLQLQNKSAFSQSSARLWNPSSLQTLNLSSSPMALFLIINLDSDQVTTLDMLRLLFQQWVEVLNARHEIRAISLDIS